VLECKRTRSWKCRRVRESKYMGKQKTQLGQKELTMCSSWI